MSRCRQLSQAFDKNRNNYDGKQKSVENQNKIKVYTEESNDIFEKKWETSHQLVFGASHWTIYCNALIPHSCNLWHQWLSKFLKHKTKTKKKKEFHSKFLILKVPGSHLVATRGIIVGNQKNDELGFCILFLVKIFI